jgi:hypothetical protein
MPKKSIDANVLPKLYPKFDQAHNNLRKAIIKKCKLSRMNAWKVLKCGAGEGWRRSVGPIM